MPRKQTGPYVYRKHLDGEYGVYFVGKNKEERLVDGRSIYFSQQAASRRALQLNELHAKKMD